MTTEEHRQRHVELHRYFDELIADYLQREGIPTGKLLSNTTVEELMKWSHRQTIKPANANRRRPTRRRRPRKAPADE